MNITRRQFIERLSAAGLAISNGFTRSGCDPLTIILPPSAPIETEDMVPALIIGSGFGGAVTALRSVGEKNHGINKKNQRLRIFAKRVPNRVPESVDLTVSINPVFVRGPVR